MRPWQTDAGGLSLEANVDALSKNGSTALLVAAREGHTVVCEALLRHSADGDDGGDKGWTPLSVAAGDGQKLAQKQNVLAGWLSDWLAGWLANEIPQQ